jgi:hypothetical protein
MMRTPAAAAPPNVIGGPGSAFTRGDGGPRAAARNAAAAASARAPAPAGSCRGCRQGADARRERVPIVVDDAVELAEQRGGLFVG